MLQNPYLWQLAPMIKVNNDELQEKLGLKINSPPSYHSLVMRLNMFNK